MRSSRGNNPCPVCGRTKDTDCRWNDTTILCHTGTDLRPGDTITIAGIKWAFIHHKGGFSGMAAVFKPHRDRNREEWKRDLRRPTPSSPAQLLAVQQKRTQWLDVLDQFFAAFDAAWNVPDFYSATPDQLKNALTAIDDAQAKAAALAPHLPTIWREHPDLKQLHRLRVEDNLKAIAYMADDARQFKQNELGNPCSVAVRAMAEGL
uniref:hypothetical protein n=1 Tax=Synechococcus sp. UW106 TaxID=368495 RepID=UPI000E0EB0CF|nr:hypothetical protein [Synechococcus sp. UW106]